MDKNTLRKQMREKRASMDFHIKQDFDNKIRMKFLASDEYKNAKVIFTYVSTAEEIDTIKIIEKALEDGKIIAVPMVKSKTKMSAIKINSLSDLCKKGSFGILEPCDGEDLSDFIDVCIVPGLAFTQKGERLGYGGGYYDRFFEAHNIEKKISFCYSYQLVTNVYNSEYDINVDRIITENP